MPDRTGKLRSGAGCIENIRENILYIQKDFKEPIYISSVW
jgi:hypothetical protein